jgi:hypothetical protein
MADEAQTIRSINWREVFPFTHLFRTFRIAVHPSKLLLALAALLLIYMGGRVLDGVWPERYLAEPGEFGYEPGARSSEDQFDAAMRQAQRLAGRPVAETDDVEMRRRGIFISFFKYEVGRVNDVAESVLANNWFGGGSRTLGVFPSIGYFLVGPGLLVHNHPLFALLFFAWFLLIWSVFGGAISRIAAVHVARDEKISVRQALRFSISKVLSFLFAPLIPLLIILVIGVVVAATGWALLHIPWVGPIVMGLVFFLALLAGFIMTLVALGTIGGFNLMFPTVAVEGSDSFDAISRSFSYVFARPWRMLFYTAVAIAYGALTYLFVKMFLFVMLLLTHFFVGWWLGGTPDRHWNGPPVGSTEPPAVMWPKPQWEDLTYDVDYAHLKTSEDIAAGAISFWVYMTIGLLGAYAISFYFSANTIIYYLMRREVDATELDDVYVEETEDEFGEPMTTKEAPTAGGSAASGAPAAMPTSVSSSTTAESSSTSSTGDTGGGARAYPVEGGSGTVSGDLGNTNQAPGGGTSNP